MKIEGLGEFPHVYSEQTRHGKSVYYYRKERRGRRIRLPAPEMQSEFKDAYWAIRGWERSEPDIPNVSAKVAQNRKRRAARFCRVERALKEGLTPPTEHEVVIRRVVRMMGTAKTRAKIKGMEYSITRDWCEDTLMAQNYRCVVTGLPFDLAPNSRLQNNPYSPSLDRINSKIGYTQENTRIVLYAVNVMLMDWGVDAVVPIAAKLVSETLTRSLSSAS